MPGQEQHHLPRNLQVRHVPVEVHPVRALQIQRHLTIEHVVDRHRTLRHRAPHTSTEMPYSTPQPAAPSLRTATTHLDGPRRSLVRYPACSICLISPRNRLSWIFSASVESMI